MEKSLYNITEDYLNIELMLMESDGEVTEAVDKALSINKDELQTKSIGYIGVIKKITTEVNYIDEEIKRLTDLKKVRKNAVERLKNSISGAMQVYNIEKIETPLNKITFRKSESVEIELPAFDLAKELQKITVTHISKTEIKKLLKDGKTFKGVKLIENKSIQIK
jgi:hypothetical protein